MFSHRSLSPQPGAKRDAEPHFRLCYVHPAAPKCAWESWRSEILRQVWLRLYEKRWGLCQALDVGEGGCVRKQKEYHQSAAVGHVGRVWGTTRGFVCQVCSTCGRLHW